MFHFDALTESGALLCIFVLSVASGPRMKLAGRKSALYPTVVYSIDCSKAVVAVLVKSLLLYGLFYEAICFVLPCVILFLYFSTLLALRLPRLGKRELILVLFVRLFDLRLFGFVCFLFLFVSRMGCGL